MLRVIKRALLGGYLSSLLRASIFSFIYTQEWDRPEVTFLMTGSDLEKGGNDLHCWHHIDLSKCSFIGEYKCGIACNVT